MADEERYTVVETAARMGKSPITIYRLIAAGRTPDRQRSTLRVGGQVVRVIKVGGTWAIVGPDLDAALRGESVA